MQAPIEIQKNVSLTLRLLEELEDSPSLAASIDGCAVWNIVIGDKSLNEYNKRVIKKSTRNSKKPIVRVFWRENDKGELSIAGFDGGGTRRDIIFS